MEKKDEDGEKLERSLTSQTLSLSLWKFLPLFSRELMLCLKERMKKKVGFLSVDAEPGDGITFFVSLSKVNLFLSFKNFFRREVLSFLNTNTCNTLKEEIQSINILLFPITFSLEDFKKKSQDLKRMVKRRWWKRGCFLCKAEDVERGRKRKRRKKEKESNCSGLLLLRKNPERVFDGSKDKCSRRWVRISENEKLRERKLRERKLRLI